MTTAPAGPAGPGGSTTGAGVVVRRLRWWDVPALMPVERAAFGSDAWTEAGFWSELAGWPESRHYVVVERDGIPCGFAGLLVVADEGTVQTVAVSPQQRRNRLGARLLTELLNEADRRDVTTVWLEVRADNTAALALYDGFGFERAGVRRGYYQQGSVDAVVMRRRRSGVRSGGPGPDERGHR